MSKCYLLIFSVIFCFSLGAAMPCCPLNDTDRDGICDVDDNCPLIENSDQKDSDQDGPGDVCDVCQGGPDSSCIAHWSFDNESDPAADSTGKHQSSMINAATEKITDSPVAWSTRALYLVGGGDHVLVEDADDLDFGPESPMTIALWFKFQYVNDQRSTYHIYGKRVSCNGAGSNYQLAHDPQRALHFGGSSSGWLTAAQDVPIDTWMFVAATYDGKSVLNLYSYRLGMDIALASQTKEYIMQDVNAAPLKIGTSGDCIAGHSFMGMIDEFSIYNQALTADQLNVLAGVK